MSCCCRDVHVHGLGFRSGLVRTLNVRTGSSWNVPAIMWYRIRPPFKNFKILAQEHKLAFLSERSYFSC